MERKVDKLYKLMEEQEWHKAIKLAAKWPQLGPQKEAIQRAASVLLNPTMYTQMGYDPDQCLAEAIEALLIRYPLK